jgi:hypothetical protein
MARAELDSTTTSVSPPDLEDRALVRCLRPVVADAPAPDDGRLAAVPDADDDADVLPRAAVEHSPDDILEPRHDATLKPSSARWSRGGSNP